MRVIGPDGKNLGIIKTEEALAKAKEAGFDLIEISPTANPPVAKIMDYGKYRYEEGRKSKSSQKGRQSETREIKVGLGTSEHDLEIKAKKASTFLEKGDRIRIEMMLRGRAKYLDPKFLDDRLKRILNYVTVEHQIVEGPQRGPRGPYIMVEKK
ncbi:MAG: translation initiation factor IF-3 [Candidatus Niyogibacteria bacterium]|nr:MAG: translation initiation factor IF-3 [Candidatus Niyogibacteria bacterium]